MMTLPVRGSVLISLAFIMSIIGFYTFAPLLPGEGGGTSIALRAVVLGICLLGLLLRTHRIHQQALIWFTPLLFLFLAFGLRLAENIYFQNLQAYIEANTLFVYYIGASIVPAICAFFYASKIGDEQIIRVLNVLSVVFVIGLIFNFQVLLTFAEDATRATLERVNSIALTNVSITFLIYFAIFSRGNARVRMMAFIIAPALLLALAFSQSRGPLVAAGLAWLVFALMHPRRNLKVLFRIVLALAIAAVVLQFALGVDLIGTSLRRFDFSDHRNLQSVLIRQLQWEQAWRQFLEDPIIGRYFFETIFFYYPHNIFLELLMALGLVGGVLFLFHLTAITKASWRIVHTEDCPKVWQFAVLVLWKELFLGFSSGNFWGSSTLWICSAFVISVAYSRERAV